MDIQPSINLHDGDEGCCINVTVGINKMTRKVVASPARQAGCRMRAGLLVIEISSQK